MKFSKITIVILSLYLGCFNNEVNAQCTDSTRFAADSLQWILGSNGNTYAKLVKYNDTLYIGGEFEYIGKFTGSCIALNTTDLSVINQPTWPKFNGDISMIIPDGNGGIIVGGIFTRVGDSARKNLAHINAAGQVTSFNPNIDGYVLSAIIHNDTLYVGGSFYNINGVGRRYMASFNMATGQLTNWAPSSDNGAYGIQCMATDGTNLFVGGRFSKINNISRINLASFDLATGNLTSWNPGAAFGEVHTMYKHGNTLYVGGSFGDLGGTYRGRIGSFTFPAGTISAWNPIADKEVYNITAQNGVVYAAGIFDYIGGQNRTRFAALDSVTGMATTWNANVSGDYGYVITVAGNTVFIGGTFYKAGSNKRINFAALDKTTGTALNPVANTYLPYAHIADVQALCVLGNRVYTGGRFASIGGYERINIAGIDLVNNKVIGLQTDTAIYPRVYAMKFDNNKLYVAGGTANLLDPSGTIPTRSERKGVAVYDIANNYALTSFNPFDTFSTFTGTIKDIEIRGNHLYLGGNFSLTYNGSFYNSLIRVDKNTGAITTWKPTIYAPLFNEQEVNDIAFLDSRLYIGGNFGTPSASNVGGLMYHDFNTGKQGYSLFDKPIDAISIQDNKIFVAGNFKLHATDTRNGFAAIDTTGSLLPWNPKQSGGHAGAVTAYNDRVYCGGKFPMVGGTKRQSLAVTDTAKGTLWPWNPDIYDHTTNILPLGDTVFIGGNMVDVSGKKLWGLARFHFNNFSMPNAIVKPALNPLCSGDTAYFTAATNIQPLSYHWQVNGINSGNNLSTYSYVPQNNDTITCGVKTTSVGCYTSDTAASNTVSMIVTPTQTPNVNITADAGPSLFPNQPINFYATHTDAGSTPVFQWLRNAVPITGAVYDTYSTNAYALSNGDEICLWIKSSYVCPSPDTALSNCIKLAIRLGVDDVVDDNNINIFPNPVKASLYLSPKERGLKAQQYLIELYDVLGRLVIKQLLTTQESVDVSSLVPGVYVVRVNGVYVSRVVKE